MQGTGMERELAAVVALRSTVCVCGAWKRPTLAFCRKCWDELPLRHHDGLYKRVGRGYGEAYQGAVNWLKNVRGIGA